MSASSIVYTELRATIADFQAKYDMANETLLAFRESAAATAAKIAEAAETTGVSLGAEADEVIGSSDEMAAALDRTSIAAARMAAGIDSASAQSSLAINAMATKMEADLAKLNLMADESAAAQEANFAKVDAASATAVAGVAGKAALAGAAVGALGVISVDMAGKYESATTRLVTSAGEQQSALKSVQDGMLQMAGEVGFSAEQLAKGMYTVESAGYHGAAGLQVLRAAAQGAKAEGADLTTVADAVSTALNDYHLPASQAATVTSQLITAVGLGKTTLQDFAGALHSVTPLAANMGISLADVTGSLAAMTSHGMSAEQASQNLAETLRTLQKPSSQATAALAQIHWTANDVVDSLSQHGLQGTLQALSEAILQKMGPSGKVLLNAFNTSKQAAANLTEALKAAPPAVAALGQKMVDGSMTVAQFRAAIKTLPVDQQNMAAGFLSLINQASGFTNTLKAGGPQALTYTQMLQAVTGNATTMNTALMLTNENAASASAGIGKIASTTADASGNVRGFAEIQGTLNQRVSEAKAGFGALAIQVGERLLPAVSTIVGWLADLAQWLSKHQVLATVLAVGIAGLTIGLLAAAAATWVFNSALLANPITWVVMALVALGAVVYEVVKHWHTIASFFSGLWGNVKRIFSEAIDWVVGVFRGWYPLILGIMSGGLLLLPALILKYWRNIVGFFEDLGHGIASAVSTAFHAVVGWFEGIPGAIGSALDAVGSAVSSGFHAVVDFFVNLPHELGFALGYAAGAVVRGAITIGEGLWHGITTGAVAVGRFFANLPGELASFFSAAGHWLLDAGRRVVTGFVWGITTDYEAVVHFFEALPGNLATFFSEASQWLLNGGTDVVRGVTNGITTGYKDTVAWFEALPGRLLAFFASAISWLRSAGGNVIHGVVNGIVDGYNDVVAWFDALPSRIGSFFAGAGTWLWDAGRDLLNGLIGGIESMLGAVGHAISSFAGGVVSGFKSALGINSPSRVMHDEVGRWVAAGLAEGITANAHLVTTSAAALSAQAVSTSQAQLRDLVGAGASYSGGTVGAGSPAVAGVSSSAGAPIVINVNVAGNAVTEKELAATMQTVMARLGQRNSQTYRSYKR